MLPAAASPTSSSAGRTRPCSSAVSATCIPPIPRSCSKAVLPDARADVWAALDATQAAEALVELDGAARAWAIDETDERRLTRIVSEFDPDDSAWIADELPDAVMEQVRRSLDEAERHLLQQTDTLPPNTVGRLMTVELVAVRDSQTIGDVFTDLRARAALPDHLDRLYVVDVRNVLRGAVSLQSLVVGLPETPVATVMESDPLAFLPEDTAAQGGAGVRTVPSRVGAGRERARKAHRPAHG